MKNNSDKNHSSRRKTIRTVIIVILLLAVIAAVCVIVFIRPGQSSSDTKKESSKQQKKEKVVLPKEERASYFAGLLDGKEFNTIAYHPIDMEKALAAYLARRLSTDTIPASLTVSGDIEENAPGKYDATVTVKDRAGDKEKASVKITVTDLDDKSTGDFSFLTEKGFIAKRENGVTSIDGVKIANKTFTLPEDYGSEITQETVRAFDRMQTDAQADDIDIFIRSDYRSYFDQKIVYQEYVDKHGRKEADRYSARPGHSEHQLGDSIDINYTDDSFADTPEGKWIDKNCYKYGFIIRYPYGKMKESMYIFEPWHLRYVGTKLAKRLYNGGDWITLEEYFGIDSTYTDNSDTDNSDTDNSQ